MIPGLGNAFNQVSNIFSGKPKNLTATTTQGSAAGEAANLWGIDQMKGHIAGGPGVYGGNIPGTQGPNAAQTQQFNMLTGAGMDPQSFQNARGIAKNIASWSPDQIAAANRSGGPGGGYMNPYEANVIGGLKGDYKDMVQMMKNEIGVGAGDNFAQGGDREKVAQGVAGAQMNKDFMNQLASVRSGGYSNAMNWLGRDLDRDQTRQTQNITNAMAGKGLNLNAASQSQNINPQLAAANALGNYGLNQQNQQNMADQFGYNQFLRKENWMPSMLGQYGQMVAGGPWQSTQTKTGQGKSDLNNLIGMGLGLGGAALGGGFFNPTA